MATFTLEEVNKHKSKESLWVAHQGKVYDVTGFIERHPGGWDVLAEKGGDDVTQVMRTAPHQHSAAAYQILNKYFIGELQQKDNNQQNGRGVGSSQGDQQTSPFPMLGWREDEIIDWNKPIFWQVGKLGKDYHEWVHSPLDRHIRLFYSDIAEYFSGTPWWVIPALWLPVATAFLISGVLNIQPGATSSLLIGTDTPAVVTVLVAGILLWTLLEYSVHRWLFHLDPPADSPFLITAHFILHGQHHKAPFDKERLVFPPVPASAFAIIFWCLLIAVFPKAFAQVLMAGTLIGYVFYDLTHYYLHHGTPYLQYFRRLKTYHVKHHFVDQKKGFGISSKFWDYPFKTLIMDSSAAHYTNNNKKLS